MLLAHLTLVSTIDTNMNIKITDHKLFGLLQAASLYRAIVGSRAYGLEHDRSDTDYLYIYPTPRHELHSVFRNHHQFQFVDEDGNDHLFVSLHNFMSNLVKGDSLLNFEALFTEGFKASILGSLVTHRTIFYTTTIVRAYLGRAKKDFKSYEKHSVGVGKNHETAREKKLIHLMRCTHFAAAILDGNFDPTGGINRTLWDKVIASPRSKQDEYARNFNAQVDFLRDKINYNESFIPVFMKVENQYGLDAVISAITQLPEYKKKCKLLFNFDMGDVYRSNEVGIVYEL